MSEIKNKAMMASEAIALVRKEMSSLNRLFVSKNALKVALKKNNCPYPQFVIESLIQHKLLIKVPGEVGVYQFATKDPIYYGSFEKTFSSKIDKAFVYQKKWHLKKPGKIRSQKTSKNSSLEEDAIQILKDLGYKILKPITEFKEV